MFKYHLAAAERATGSAALSAGGDRVMAATTDAAKHCPQCGAVLDPLAYASGQPFACGGCGARMKKNPQRAESGESPVVPPAVDGGLLEIVEDLLI